MRPDNGITPASAGRRFQRIALIISLAILVLGVAPAYTLADQADLWVGRLADPARVEQARDQLRDLGDKAVPALLKGLKSPDRNIRSESAFVLGRVGSPRAVDPLIQVLGDKATVVREKAAYALGELADARATDALVQSLGDPESSVRANASFALGHIGSNKATSALIVTLLDRDADVRNQAACALGFVNDKKALGPLAWVLRNEKQVEVRAMAASSMGNLRDLSAAANLIDLLDDGDVLIRARAIDGLFQLTAQRYDYDPRQSTAARAPAVARWKSWYARNRVKLGSVEPVNPETFKPQPVAAPPAATSTPKPKPVQVEPSNPAPAKPQPPATTPPSEQPVKPNSAEPPKPVAPEPVKPVTPEPTKPVVPEPVQPVTPEPIKPVVPEPVPPVAEPKPGPAEPGKPAPPEPEPVKPTLPEPQPVKPVVPQPEPVKPVTPTPEANGRVPVPTISVVTAGLVGMDALSADVAADARDAFGRALALATSGKSAEASEAFENLSQKLPGSVAVLYDLALTQQRLGLAEPASKTYERVLTLNPGHGASLNNLGVLNLNAGRVAAAGDCFRRALKADADHPDLAACYNLGDMLFGCCSYDGAIVCYELLWDHHDRLPEGVTAAAVHLRRMQCNLALGRRDDLDKLFAEEGPPPDEPGLLRAYASYRFRQGDYAGALHGLQRARRVDRSDPETYDNLARFYLAVPDGAVRDPMESSLLAEQAVRANPRQMRYWRTLLDASLACQRPLRATQALATIMELDADGAQKSGQ